MSAAVPRASAGPTVEERAARPYAYLRASVRMDEFPVIADRLGELIGWVSAQGAAFAGAPFFRFRTVDPAGASEVEAGLPVLTPPAPEGDYRVGTLPSGRYAAIRHTGHPDGLFEALGTLTAWTERQGLTLDLTRSEPGGVERWGCRLESYLTDPREEPDPNRWETELALRLAD
ncbi:GyrI-like domain-containing protein [Streptomyces sp. NPDC057638]|uniref:GyrI-like domain-containing protein n=1 Tax=Streptomyces sp. NPDC057638 TaxID=3346190 RepID=UPI0036A122A5